MGEQILLVLHKQIVTAVQGALCHDRKISIEQVPQGALVEPVGAQSPFRARIKQTTHRQKIGNLQRVRSLAADFQSGSLEGVEFELILQSKQSPHCRGWCSLI